MPSPALALAWKELNLGRDGVLAVMAGHGVLVVARRLAIAAGATSVEDFTSLAAPATACPLVALAAATFAAAVLVAGERRKGTWEWHALLPVAWWKVLAVKLAVIVAAGLGAAACAWLVLVLVVALGAVALLGLLPNERFRSLAALPIGWVLFAAATGFLGGIHCLATAIVWRSSLLAFAAGLVAALCSGIVWIAGMSHVGRSPALLAGFGDARFTPLASLVSWALPLLLLLIPLVLVRPWLRDDRAVLKVRWGAAFVVLHAVWLAGCYTLA